MTSRVTAGLAAGLGLGVMLVPATAATAATSGQRTSFTVTVTNVSTGSTLPASDTAVGKSKPVPLSPGAYAVYTGQNPIFTPGRQASAGLESIAEDGFPMQEAAALKSASGVTDSGTFSQPAGGSKALAGRGRDLHRHRQPGGEAVLGHHVRPVQRRLLRSGRRHCVVPERITGLG